VDVELQRPHVGLGGITPFSGDPRSLIFYLRLNLDIGQLLYKSDTKMTQLPYEVLSFCPLAAKKYRECQAFVLRTSQRGLGVTVSNLELLHLYVSDSEFNEFHEFLNLEFWKTELSFELALAEKSKFINILGPDLDIQSRPHLRISRPNRSEDNVGYHRDIDYGGSVYEHSIWVPITQVQSGGGMQLLPYSIHRGYEGYQFLQKETEYKKGSARQVAGLPYKLNNVILSHDEYKLLTEPNIADGQYLMIPLLLVHGSEINSSPLTRVSFDMRIVDSKAKDDKSSLQKRKILPIDSKDPYPYYRPLCRSNFSRILDIFLSAKSDNSP
jgi:hypothetical protein